MSEVSERKLSNTLSSGHFNLRLPNQKITYYSPSIRPRTALPGNLAFSGLTQTVSFPTTDINKMCKKKGPAAVIQQLTQSKIRNMTCVSNIIKNIKSKYIIQSKRISYYLLLFKNLGKKLEKKEHQPLAQMK